MTITTASSARTDRQSRVRLAAWDFATSVLFLIVTTAIALVSTPLLIGWLGQERYGAVRVLIEYSGYLALLELGLSGAVAPMLARALGSDDTVSVRQILAAASQTYLRVTLVMIGAGLALWPLIPRLVPVQPEPNNPIWWSQVLGGSSLPLDAIRLVNSADLSRAWLIVLAGGLLLVLSPYRALVQANQRGYQVNLLQLLQTVVVVILSLALAYYGGGISGQCLANFLGLLPTYLILVAMALARHSGLFRDLRTPVPPEIRQQMTHLSRASLKLQICGRISLMTNAIVVGGFLGSAQVTVLYVTQRLAMLLLGPLGGVGTAVWAGLADLHARGHHDVFRRRLLDLTQGISLLGVAALGPIAVGNARFIALWVGTDQYGGLAITLTAAVNTYLISLFILWSWCFSGTGQAPLVVRISLVSALVDITTSVILTAVFRLTVGPLLGTTIALLSVLMVRYPGLLETHFGIPWRQLIRAMIRPLAVGLPVSVAFWLVMRTHPAGNLLTLVLEMGVASAVILGLGYRLLLDPSERQEWRARLAQALPFARRAQAESQDPSP